jgi:hypothetical protein
MEERDLIVSFLQTTHRLRKAAAASGSSSGQAANGFEPDTWIKCYEDLAQQLAGGNAQLSDAGGEPRACWKISQDILIRLRRLHRGIQDTRHVHVLFTEHDRDALDRRLLDIQQRLGITTEDWMATE